MGAFWRIPIRLRLTLAFALVMAVVLAATGLFVYVRLASTLDQALNAALLARAGDVAALVRQSDQGLSQGGEIRLAERGESFAQVIDAHGRVIDTTPQLGRRPLLTSAQLAQARHETAFFDAHLRAPVDSRSRLLATSLIAQDQRLVVVVGTSLEPRAEALSSLLGQMLIGGPAALLLAALAGYGLAAAALRPVESMRARATSISGSDSGARLPLSPARDEIRRLGETLNAMLERLDSTIRRERRFVTDASHELRTPLALLRTELELALRRTRSVEELEAALRSAAEETDRLSQLAEDLLVLARADDGRLPVRRQPLLVDDVLEGVATRFGERAARGGRAVVAQESGLEVHGDALRLEQALGNLVDNSLRYGAGQVTLSARAAPGFVELHVADEGPGFDPFYLPRAFERFSRADESRARGGAGLGLSIVDVVARAHGGAAHASNGPAGGADVWLEIAATAGEWSEPEPARAVRTR